MFAISLASACSGKDEPADRLATVEGFCKVWAEQACNQTVVDRCAATDAEACQDAQAEFCESMIPAGKYSRSGADACLLAVRRAYEDGDLEPEEAAAVLRLEDPCDKVISGSGSPGDACKDTTDCSTELELVCIKRAGDSMGLCAEPDPKEGGRSCTAPNAVCVEGFYCNGENCVENRGEGQSCSEAMPCAQGFKCKPAGSAAAPDAGAGDAGAAEPTAECVAQAKRGEACKVDSDCETGICGEGSNPICLGVIVLTGDGDTTVCDNLR